MLSQKQRRLLFQRYTGWLIFSESRKNPQHYSEGFYMNHLVPLQFGFRNSKNEKLLMYDASKNQKTNYQNISPQNTQKV